MSPRILLVLIYIAILFLDRLDVAFISGITPSLASEFQAPLFEIDWISTSFIIAQALTMPLTAWCEKKVGGRILFVTSLFIFTISSYLCYLSSSAAALILCRAIQGVGAGILLPMGMGMIYREFNPSQFAKVASYTLMPALLAPAFAPLLGSVTVKYHMWRAVFLMNIPVGIAAILTTIFLLPKENHTPSSQESGPFDFWGFLFVSTTLGCGFYALTLVSRYGLWDLSFLLYSAVTIMSAVAFIIREKSIPHPLVDISFFKIPLFAQAHMIVFCLQCCYYGSILLIALYLRNGVGIDSLTCGFIILPQSIGTILMLPVSARLFNLYGPRLSFIFGFIGIGVTYLMLLQIQNPDQALLAGGIMFLRGMAISFINGGTQASCMLAVPPSATTKVGIIFNSTRQIAIGFGIALSSVCLSLQGAEEKWDIHSISRAAFVDTFFTFTAISLLGMIVAWTVNNKFILEKLKASSREPENPLPSLQRSCLDSRAKSATNREGDI